MEFPNEIINSYPYPIAKVCEDFNNADNVNEAFLKLAQLFEIILKYLSSIAAAQCFHDNLDDEKITEKLKGLNKPSLGHWLGLLQIIIKFYQKGEYQNKFICKELLSVYDKPDSVNKDLATAYNFMVNKLPSGQRSDKKAISLDMFFHQTIHFRNETWGKWPGRINAEFCEEVNPILAPALLETLNKLRSLADYALNYVAKVEVDKGSFHHYMQNYNGLNPGRTDPYVSSIFPSETQEVPYFQEKQVYLCVDRRPVLSLHPLVVVIKKDLHLLGFNEQNEVIEYFNCHTGETTRPKELDEFILPVLESGDHQQLQDVKIEETLESTLRLPDTQEQKEVEKSTSDIALEELLKSLDRRGLKVLKTALKEAALESLLEGHFYVGVEHLFVGLTKVEDGITSQVLKQVGISPKAARDYIRLFSYGLKAGDHKTNKKIKFPSSGWFTPRCRSIFSLAKNKAEQEQSKIIGDKHILLAIFEEGEGIPNRVLEGLGLNISKILSLIESSSLSVKEVN